MASSSKKIGLIVGVVVVAAIVGAIVLMRRREPPPPPNLPVSDADYAAYVEDWELGTAALDVDSNQIALTHLTKAIDRVPSEPSGWANRGLMYLRQEKNEDAARDLNKAHELAPESPEIETLLGLLAKRLGEFDRAIGHLRKAVEKRPNDVAAMFSLAQVVAQAAGPDSDKEYQQLMEAILQAQPKNLKILLERARVAVQRRDAQGLKDTLSRLKKLVPDWQPDARKQFEKVNKTASENFSPDLLDDLTVLGNLLMSEPDYHRYAIAVDPASVGESLQQFLRLKPLSTQVDPADTGLTVSSAPAKGVAADLAKQRWDVAIPFFLTGEDPPAILVANGQIARRVDASGASFPFPAKPNGASPSPDGVLAIDWTNDKKNGLVLAGSGGLAFWGQGDRGSFADLTAKTGLAANILHDDYFGAWAADYDLDGDLDIVLAKRTGAPLVLRNNRDGTFKVQQPFAGIESVRAFAWADFDNDGAPDAAFIDAEGRLQVYSNERGGVFRQRTQPENLGRLLAITVAEVNDDGVFDLLALKDDGAIIRISDRDHGQRWQVAEIARWEGFPAKIAPGSARLLVADLDNNGMPDLIASTPKQSRLWLGEAPDKFTALSSEIPGPIFAAECMGQDGRVDLLSLSNEGQPIVFKTNSTKNYHWQDVRTAASNGRVSGEDRINSFGIGGEMEMRAGQLIQKMPIHSPRTHFGLGHRSRGQVIRIVWPNGQTQVEFLNSEKPIDADQVVVAQQRLKGSCPFLFTWNGKEVAFVTDFLWSSPLGMYINGQNQGSFAQTQEWVKIRSDQLVARDGYYDVRVHANLWETHFIDYGALITVDHPADTEIFVDERFALTPMTPQIHLTTVPKPVAHAVDDQGTDVTEIVSKVDGKYLDTFGRGRFQGITRDHWVEVDLGDDAPTDGPIWLVATGWIHPTDSSINMAIGKGKHDAPQPLTLEIPDGQGGWKANGPPLGFPAGKNKTMMIPIHHLGRRFRLRTNMEIYWDALRYARGLDAKDLHQQRLSPQSAELRYRGILEMTTADKSSPELPHYDRVIQGPQYWRDLIGFYTRYGDIRELLSAVDDRYAILNAGDEIALRFPVPSAQPTGWKRDFVWVADGWEKDGDFNTGYSKTVLPLPYHGMKGFDHAPGRLEDDPVYRRFPNDWRIYHTRYVTPSDFEQGLRSFRRSQP